MKGKNALTLRRKEIIQSYVMIACSVIGLCLFVIYPIGWTFRWCLYNYSGILAPVYVGFENFAKIFGETGTRFWQAVGNTFVFAIGKLAVELPLALVLAYILASNLKGKDFFRTIYFLPSMLSVAVIGIVFFYLFGSYNGVVNEVLVAFGGKRISWFTNGTLAMIVLMITSIWQNFGINMLFFMTGLQSIPVELYESAAIDGASSAQRFFKITIPMLGPVTQMVVMNALLGSLKVTDLVLVMTNGAPNGKTEVMMSYIYKQFFSSVQAGTANNYGYASALCIITAGILGIITLIYLRMTKKSSEIY
ncbi:MAG TPA: sugar ABC transporter permease [Clostridiaceae bacterium]|nr:sugar ABC transporter permease [Clostridiaceae bacterium]